MAKKVGGKISIDKFSSAIDEILEEFGSITGDVLEEAKKETAEETAEKIRADAPVAKVNGGKYKQSIVAEKSFTRKDKGSWIIHADAPEYRLTHLLEKGHRIANTKKEGKKTSTQAFPHWKPAEEKVGDLLVEKVKEKLRK